MGCRSMAASLLQMQTRSTGNSSLLHELRASACCQLCSGPMSSSTGQGQTCAPSEART